MAALPVGSPVNVSSLSNLDNANDQILIFDNADDSAATLSNALLVLTRQLLAARRPGIMG
jgi:hypothetical protein